MSSPTFLYFAYGSNLFTDRIREKNKTAIKKATGLLDGHQLEFAHWSNNWGGAVANILPHATEKVHGVLWELRMEDMKSLDRQEGVPKGIYERMKINVESDGQSVECWTYKLTHGTREGSIEKYGKDNLKPSAAYKEVILKGANEHNLPSWYIDNLQRIPCQE